MMAPQRTMIDLWTKSILFWVRNLSVKIADFKRKCYGYMIHWLCISWMFFPIFSIIRKIHSPKQFYPKKMSKMYSILFYAIKFMGEWLPYTETSRSCRNCCAHRIRMYAMMRNRRSTQYFNSSSYSLLFFILFFHFVWYQATACQSYEDQIENFIVLKRQKRCWIIDAAWIVILIEF